MLLPPHSLFAATAEDYVLRFIAADAAYAARYADLLLALYYFAITLRACHCRCARAFTLLPQQMRAQAREELILRDEGTCRQR